VCVCGVCVGGSRISPDMTHMKALVAFFFLNPHALRIFFFGFSSAMTGCGSKHVVALVRMQLRKRGKKRWVGEAEG
jgi:hypothetical protein